MKAGELPLRAVRVRCVRADGGLALEWLDAPHHGLEFRKVCDC